MKTQPSRHHLDRHAASLRAIGMATGDPDDLLTTQQVADWLRVSVQWLELGRSRGYGPAFVKLAPRLIRYKRRAVLDWLRERAEYRY